MSTDYGLCCECGALWITDNVGKDDAADILCDIHYLAILNDVMLAIRTDIYLSTYFSSSYDLDGLLEFAQLHHGHQLQVIDEYLYAYLREINDNSVWICACGHLNPDEENVHCQRCHLPRP